MRERERVWGREGWRAVVWICRGKGGKEFLEPRDTRKKDEKLSEVS